MPKESLKLNFSENHYVSTHTLRLWSSVEITQEQRAAWEEQSLVTHLYAMVAWLALFFNCHPPPHTKSPLRIKKLLLSISTFNLTEQLVPKSLFNTAALVCIYENLSDMRNLQRPEPTWKYSRLGGEPTLPITFPGCQCLKLFLPTPHFLAFYQAFWGQKAWPHCLHKYPGFYE